MIKFLRKLLSLPTRPENEIFRPDMTAAWQLIRRAEVETDKTLSEEAKSWLAGIAEHARPSKLVERYPRIANQLAQQWGDADQCRSCLDDLLGDRRGNRTGFPPAIRAEIVRLERFNQLRRPDPVPMRRFRHE